METTLTPPMDAFETEICSRCCGSGEYSYCQMYGRRCFKCHGKGKVYSKRGHAALLYAAELRTVPVEQIEVGWLLWVPASPMGGKSGWMTVTEVVMESGCSTLSKNEAGEEISRQYMMIGAKEHGQYCLPGSTMQAVPNKERLAEVRALALAYQATLSKQGKPMKRARKAGNAEAA